MEPLILDRQACHGRHTIDERALVIECGIVDQGREGSLFASKRCHRPRSAIVWKGHALTIRLDIGAHGTRPEDDVE
jgi:hypothetical protein